MASNSSCFSTSEMITRLRADIASLLLNTHYFIPPPNLMSSTRTNPAIFPCLAADAARGADLHDRPARDPVAGVHLQPHLERLQARDAGCAKRGARSTPATTVFMAPRIVMVTVWSFATSFSVPLSYREEGREKHTNKGIRQFVLPLLANTRRIHAR